MKLRSCRRKPEESIDDLLPRFNEQGEWSSHVPEWKVSSEKLLMPTLAPESAAVVHNDGADLPGNGAHLRVS